MDNLDGSLVGRQIAKALHGVEGAPPIEQTLSDALAGKAVSTLRARASSLLAFGRWKKGINVLSTIFPITEGEAYAYVRELKELNAPRTKPSRFLEAVSFSFHMLGADVDNAMNSPRVKGAAVVPLAIPRKKTPLSVAQVTFLERMTVEDPGQRGIFCGYLCMILHMRLRWMDGQFCQEEPFLDLFEGRGFLECRLYHHKNAGRQKHAKRLLPAACNIPGFSGIDWATTWLANRYEHGLVAMPGIPTMPAPLTSGGWSLVPLEASQATSWLRELLNNLHPKVPMELIGTHSLKATMLSMMAKVGCDTSLRRLAGYHVDPADKSALEYSRDAQAPLAMTRLSQMNTETGWYDAQNRAPDVPLEEDDALLVEGQKLGTPSEPYEPSECDEEQSIDSLNASESCAISDFFAVVICFETRLQLLRAIVAARNMSMVDSTAVFEGRAKAIGLTEAVVHSMGLRGWTTHATFAFSVATQPGVDEQAFLDGVVIPVLGSAEHTDAPKLRRLFFESHTLTSADLRRKVDATETEAPRKLPAPEIAQRLELLQKRISPLVIANVLEPSHQLINAMVQCVEDGRVRYIEWSKCTSRTQEAVNKDPSISACLNTELDVHNALRRRGVAYEVAQAMSFEVHEKILNFFFFELKKEPVEGFAQVTLQQLASADRELHVRLAEMTRGGFKPGPGGELPLDIPTTEILEGPELRWMLMPMPKRMAPKTSPEPSKVGKPTADGEPKRTRNEVPKKTKEEALKLKRLKRTPMPKKLVGCTPCNDEGKPFCFAYNLGTCSSSTDCEKGLHACCKKGCGKRHSFVTAHKQGS
eukprot:s5263_g3.t1